MNDTIEKNGLENLPDGVTKEQLLDIVEQVRGSRREMRSYEEIQIGNISAARVRLEKLKAQRKPIIELFQIGDEDFHVKRLNYQGLIDLALSVSRDGHNVLNINDESGVRSVTIAVLMASVCNADGTPYFAHEDAQDFIDTPDDAALVSALFAAANAANPDIFNTLKKS